MFGLASVTQSINWFVKGLSSFSLNLCYFDYYRKLKHANILIICAVALAQTALNYATLNPLMQKEHLCPILNNHSFQANENCLKAAVAFGELFICLSDIFGDINTKIFVFKKLMRS